MLYDQANPYLGNLLVNQWQETIDMREKLYGRDADETEYARRQYQRHVARLDELRHRAEINYSGVRSVR